MTTDTVFEIDFNDDIVIEETPIVEQTEEIQEELQDDEIQEEVLEDIQEEDEVDENTHELFIEGWKETGMLALPDDYDYKGKTVTAVMADHAKHLNELIKEAFVNKLPEDMREAYTLALNGKISNAKEFLKYQVDAEVSVEAITNEDQARKYLESYYKSTGDLDEDAIEILLDKLEVQDKLVEKAELLKTKQSEKQKQSLEAKKQEMIQREEAERIAQQKEIDVRASKMKDYIKASNWTNNHKKFVEEEISSGMKTTVSLIQDAIKNPEVTPEFVSLMSRLLVKDESGKVQISKDALKDYASTKVGKELKSEWEAKLDRNNLPKRASKTGVKHGESSALEWEFDPF